MFKVGDKVVYVDDFMPDSVSVVSEVNDRVWLNGNNAVCIKEMIKHAEDEEIAAGHRIGNDMGDNTHIENHVSPNCKKFEEQVGNNETK